MKFWAISTTTASYDWHHCDCRIAFGLVDGLLSQGREACVLWGGGRETIDGIPHRNLMDVTLCNGDVLLYYSRLLGDDLFDSERHANLRGAAEKWWFPSYVDEYNGKFFDRIFIDNANLVEKVQANTPHAKVDWLMFGCPHNVFTAWEYPFPYEGKHLVYVGRMAGNHTESQMAQFKELMNYYLPSEYHLWVVSSTVQIPAHYHNPSFSGKLIYAPIASGYNPFTQKSVDGVISVHPWLLRLLVEDYFDHNRIHFLGPMAYGSFFNLIMHADAVIDCGYTYEAVGPNCKIMEPLRYGTPVFAHGISFSFPLIEQYGDGKVVPFNDYDAWAKEIQMAPPKDYIKRNEQGCIFRNDHSWRSRAKRLLEITGY